ncbi:hypothetical protein [Clostridium sp.]|uniref:hypothetical protein n=1 Tax=Clostridium sp. TaxID=1506 RepID=UPI003D6DA412
MYDFLNNFHKRMEKLSYSFLIDNKVSTLTTFKDYFTSVELINLVYSLMCFVLDKSLKDEECTLNSMAVILEDLSSKYYDRILTEEEAYDITHFIVYKILRNDGKPFMFTTIDYSACKNIVFDFHLLQQRTSKQDNNKSTFTLTQEGYRLILGALEVDEKTQIDINQMILEMSLKRKNFSQGLLAVENLNNLITAQINVVNNFIYRTRENIFSIEQRDFEDNFLKNIEVLVEQNKKFDELKAIIIIEEERLSRTDVEITKDNYESLKQLSRIKELLINISYKAGELITSHFHFKDEYKKALYEASFYYNNKRINIKDDLLKPIEMDALKLGNVFKLFNPLFKAKLSKKFNINSMFNDQKLYFKEDAEDEILIDLIDNEDNELILKQKNRLQYREIISVILNFLVSTKDSDLKTLMQLYNSKSVLDYRKLIPTMRKFSEVLIELLRIGIIDVEEMITDQNDAYDNEEIEFDLRALLVEEIQEKYKLVSIKYIHFNKCTDGVKLTITEKPEEEASEDFVTVQNLNCPNIIMKLE